MNIAVVGTGYVGLTSAACFADLGHTVIGVDVDAKKIEDLQHGIIPIKEEGLSELVRFNVAEGRLSFTTSLPEVLDRVEIVVIAVGTPSDEEGRAELKYLKEVIATIATHSRAPKLLVTKSTVPPGTGRMIEEFMATHTTVPMEVCSCPEFLREGTGVKDFFNPDRIVIGVRNEAVGQRMLRLFKHVRAEKLITTVESAEMIKYGSNAFLATKISFINEIANLCDQLGADVEDVAYGMGLDQRIGPKFLNAGLGYGGSCFPKDVRALHQIANGNGYDFKLLKSVIEVNQQQRRRVLEKLKRHVPDLNGRRIAILGLTFKPHTDDTRESAAWEMIDLLRAEGAMVQAFDPVVSMNGSWTRNDVTLIRSLKECLVGVDAAVLVTEWSEFIRAPWEQWVSLFRRPIIIDGRNALDPKKMQSLGYIYEAMGRGHLVSEPISPVTQHV